MLYEVITSASPDVLLDKAPTKIARALVYFRHLGSLNRFEAEDAPLTAIVGHAFWRS